MKIAPTRVRETGHLTGYGPTRGPAQEEGSDDRGRRKKHGAEGRAEYGSRQKGRKRRTKRKVGEATNQKQEEKKAKRAKEGWKGQRTQGRVLTRGKGNEGKRKKHNEELRNESPRRECDKEKENAMTTQTKPQKKGKANERQLSNKETEEKESCNFLGEDAIWRAENIYPEEEQHNLGDPEIHQREGKEKETSRGRVKLNNLGEEPSARSIWGKYNLGKEPSAK